MLTGHLVAFCTILIWGVTFISTKILLRDFTPLEILFLRFFLGWLALWLLCPLWLKSCGVKQELLFASAGLSGVTLYFLLENMALTYTFASNVGVIVATAPFFTAILAWLFLDDEKPGPGFLAGFITAMCGICLISLNGASFSLNPLGDFLALLASIAWAVYSIITRKLATAGYGSLRTTRRIFFYGLVFMIPVMLFSDFGFDPALLLIPANYCNLVFLGIGASALCFVTWTFSLRLLGAVRASMYIYLVPVITLLAAAIVLDEPLTLYSTLGIILTILGLILAESRCFGLLK